MVYFVWINPKLWFCCLPYLHLFVCVCVHVPAGKDVSDRWYNEVNQYNFNQPGFSSATGKNQLLHNVEVTQLFPIYALPYL